MSSAFAFPVDYIADPEKFGAVGLGELYIGVVDGDPANNPADRIQVYLARQNDTDLPIPQPIALSAGGVPLYNGSPATLKVSSSYSTSVISATGQQVFYSPRGGELIDTLNNLQSEIESLSDKIEAVTQVLDVISDLLLIDNLVDGRLFFVKEFAAGHASGGGFFVSKMGFAVADHMITFPSSVDGYYFRRTQYSRLDVTMAGVRTDGVLSDAALQTAVTVCQGKSLYFPDGEYNISAYPTGIDGVRFEGSSRVTWTNVKMPLFSGVLTGGMETAIVSGVIRYYDSGTSGAGWYMLVDQGDIHDPIMLGPVEASGNYSQHLTVGFSDLGLDRNLWTPSGFSVTPDETFAKEGVLVGASVGTDKIIIEGSFSIPATLHIRHTGTDWVVEGGGLLDGSISYYDYTIEWIDGGTDAAYMLITRTRGKRTWHPASYLGNAFSFSPCAINSGLPALNPPIVPLNAGEIVDGSGNDQVRVVFYNISTGARIQAPDANFRFTMQDLAAKNTQLRWQDIATPSFGNIWIMGTFVRKPSSL